MFDFNVNLELYKVFYTAALMGSMTKAAHKLYIGQPAVSKAIKVIEEKFGVVLFTRNPKGVSLTEEGQIFYRHITQAMEQVTLGENALLKMKKQKKQKEKHLKIEICAMQYKQLILPHIKTFFECCGNKEIFDISPTIDSYSSLDLLELGKIDCCLVTKPAEDNDFNFIKLFTYNDYLMGSPDYIASITQNGHTLVENAVLISNMNDGIMSYYEKERLKQLWFASKMKVTSMEHTISLAKLGVGVGFIAEELVMDEIENRTLAKVEILHQHHERDVGFLLNKNQTENADLMEFVDFYCNFYNNDRVAI